LRFPGRSRIGDAGEHIERRSKVMKLKLSVLAAVLALAFAGVALAQYPILDIAANRVIQKYQTATCEQLWQERAANQGKPKNPEEQQLLTFLRDDPNMRALFLNKVAGPVANKMFECGMIP
jgi:hypothetical protein